MIEFSFDLGPLRIRFTISDSGEAEEVHPSGDVFTLAERAPDDARDEEGHISLRA